MFIEIDSDTFINFDTVKQVLIADDDVKVYFIDGDKMFMTLEDWEQNKKKLNIR